MKKILSPFLAFLMVMVVGCTDDVTIIGEDAVSYPIIISSLDDVEFESNFSILDVETSTFIVDPKTKTITRESFTWEFNDANYFPNSTDTLLSAVVTESSSTNGYTIRFSPKKAALDLVDEYVVECTMRMWYDNGANYVEYKLDITLGADAPAFYTYPTDVRFEQDFTSTDYVYTSFTLNPGSFEIDLDDIYLSTSENYYYRLYDVEVDPADESGNTYIATIQATTRAINLADSVGDTGYFIINYVDKKGDIQTISSIKKQFNLTFPADYVETFVYMGPDDIVLPDNFVADPYTNWVFNATTNTNLCQFFVLMDSDDSPTLDNYSFPNWSDYYPEYFGIAVTTPDGYAGYNPRMYRVNLHVYPQYSAKEFYDMGYTEPISLPVDLKFITNMPRYTECVAEGSADSVNYYELQRLTVILPPYNNLTKPTFSDVTSYALFKSEFTNSDPAVEADDISSGYSITFTLDRDIWDPEDNKFEYSIDYGNNKYLNWIDESTTTITVTQDSETNSDGDVEYFDTYTGQIELKATSNVVNYASDATESYYSKYLSDYNSFALDSGLLDVVVKLDYNNGENDFTVMTDPIPVRFMPSKPIEGGEQLIYLGDELSGIWVASEDEKATVDGITKTQFTWAEAVDLCANKEAHPTIPWAWRLPTSAELITISKYRSSNFSLLNSLNVSYDSYGNKIESAFEERFWSISQKSSSDYAYSVYFNNESSALVHKNELYRVRCIIDLIQYPDSDAIPGYGGTMY